MDVKAILASSRQDLMQLGLIEKGHIICLKAFAMRSGVDGAKKETLAEAIKKSTYERTKKVKRTKMIQVGWKHSNRGHSFNQVKKQCGGGVREISLNFTVTLNAVKEEAKNCSSQTRNQKNVVQ